jgi:hypothetical protein
MLTNDSLIDWWCANCGHKLNKPAIFFISAEPGHCPSCDAPVDGAVIRELLAIPTDRAEGAQKSSDDVNFVLL